LTGASGKFHKKTVSTKSRLIENGMEMKRRWSNLYK
jgi:hypothetical protein